MFGFGWVTRIPKKSKSHKNKRNKITKTNIQNPIILRFLISNFGDVIFLNFQNNFFKKVNSTELLNLKMQKE